MDISEVRALSDKATRRRIARILTVMTERQRAAVTAEGGAE